MHVVKYMRPSQTATQDRERLARAVATSRLTRSDWVIERLKDAVGSPECGYDVRALLETACTRLVEDELKGLAALKGEPSVLADFFENEHERVSEFSNIFGALFRRVMDDVRGGDDGAGVLEITVPLVTRLGDAANVVQAVVEQCVRCNFDGEHLALGAATAAKVIRHLCQVSGLSEEQACKSPHRVKWPTAVEMTPVELVAAYLRDTPFALVLLAPVPIMVSDQTRMEHCVITAGAGHGKTQTLQHMIACDLDRPKGQEVGIVVIDSQGDLIDRIKRLRVFACNDRLLVVDASDVTHPVGLNIFNLGGASLDGLSRRDREQAMTAMIQLYEFIIGGLFGAEMTQKQSTTFRFLIRLMLSIPGATIHTLRECLGDPKQFMGDIERLPATAREFFTNEFMDKHFTETRKQILRRLWAVLQNPAFERMFASSENRLDLYKALNEGRVVLCNTSREFLQNECRVFGRYCIAVALKAAFDRARLAPEQRRTSFLYIDEASDYFDESVGQLLVQARKYRLGLVLAHQALEQMSDGLRALVMSNTSIKMVGGASGRDARYLAPELRTTPEFILEQNKERAGTQFATYVRNVTGEAVSWRIPFFTMEKMPTMSRGEFATVLARIRSEVSSGQHRNEESEMIPTGRPTSPSRVHRIKRDDDDVGSDFSEPL